MDQAAVGAQLTVTRRGRPLSGWDQHDRVQPAPLGPAACSTPSRAPHHARRSAPQVPSRYHDVNVGVHFLAPRKRRRSQLARGWGAATARRTGRGLRGRARWIEVDRLHPHHPHAELGRRRIGTPASVRQGRVAGLHETCGGVAEVEVRAGVAVGTGPEATSNNGESREIRRIVTVRSTSASKVL